MSVKEIYEWGYDVKFKISNIFISGWLYEVNKILENQSVFIFLKF